MATTKKGGTEKLSVSVAKKDIGVLRARARKLYAGNLSAVIAEAAARIREEEGRQELLTWLRDGRRTPTAAERQAALGELLGEAKPKRRGRAA